MQMILTMVSVQREGGREGQREGEAEIQRHSETERESEMRGLSTVLLLALSPTVCPGSLSNAINVVLWFLRLSSCGNARETFPMPNAGCPRFVS